MLADCSASTLLVWSVWSDFSSCQDIVPAYVSRHDADIELFYGLFFRDLETCRNFLHGDCFCLFRDVVLNEALLPQLPCLQFTDLHECAEIRLFPRGKDENAVERIYSFPRSNLYAHANLLLKVGIGCVSSLTVAQKLLRVNF